MNDEETASATTAPEPTPTPAVSIADDTGSSTTAATPEAADVTVKPHECGPGCEHDHGIGRRKKPNPTRADFEKGIKHLLHERYDEIKDRFDKSFVMENKKTGVIVEIRAASSVHACNLIGWRPKNARLIEIKDIKKEVKDGDKPAGTSGTEGTAGQPQGQPGEQPAPTA